MSGMLAPVPFRVVLSSPDSAFPGVIVTLPRAATLPEAMVRLGANQEMFYAGMDDSELPKEGREVRVYMTESFLRQFVSIHHIEAHVVEKAALMQAVDALAESFHARYPRR